MSNTRIFTRIFEQRTSAKREYLRGKREAFRARSARISGGNIRATRTYFRRKYGCEAAGFACKTRALRTHFRGKKEREARLFPREIGCETPVFPREIACETREERACGTRYFPRKIRAERTNIPQEYRARSARYLRSKSARSAVINTAQRADLEARFEPSRLESSGRDVLVTSAQQMELRAGGEGATRRSERPSRPRALGCKSRRREAPDVKKEKSRRPKAGRRCVLCSARQILGGPEARTKKRKF